MKRILIIGNSGSGKSWLAAQLAELLTIHEGRCFPNQPASHDFPSPG
nr:AAA family ATPase [Aeromonas sp. CU5]